jgi:hypothetical protein
MMIAANHPLASTGAARAELATRLSRPRLVQDLEAARVLGSAGVDRLIRENPAILNTDHNRWIEYASPRYEASGYDWETLNRRFLARYQ